LARVTTTITTTNRQKHDIGNTTTTISPKKEKRQKEGISNLHRSFYFCMLITALVPSIADARSTTAWGEIHTSDKVVATV
jgi:hypothetical protein